MSGNARKHNDFSASRFAVAPMIDWTDRHCRFFHRQLTSRALLFTEMVVDEAILHGDRDRLLGFSPAELPVALQLGGSDPQKLAIAARAGEASGYSEINLNCGCPSDRVQSGTFGACLMRDPERVAACVAAMKASVAIPVTVKCRIGVDDQDPEIALDALADAVVAAGVDGLWVHARKAWLQGLSPKENREIPPLDYDRVHRLKQRLPDLFVGINGGIKSLASAQEQLAVMDGVMLGRAAYQEPALLAEVDRVVYGEAAEGPSADAVMERMMEYAASERTLGVPLHHIVRHMLGLYHGQPGARRFRQILTVEGSHRGAGIEVMQLALDAVRQARAALAA